MKKVHLYAASAMFAALLASGMAQAVTAAPAKETKATVQQEEAKKLPHRPLKELSEEKATLFREAMKKMHEENKELFGKMGTLMKEQKEILKAPTFDKAAYIAKSAEIQDVHSKISTARAATIAEVASKMTVEERDALSQPHFMMMDGSRRGFKHGNGGPMGGPRDGRGPRPMAPEVPVEE